MKKPLPIGIDNFKQIIDGNYCYVDKTGLIKDLIDDGSYAVLMSRPRRFGKTLNLSMIKYFFEKSEYNNSDLFKGLFIEDAGEGYKKHQGRYPVINLSFKDANFSSWEDTFEALKRAVSNEYKRHDYLLESSAFKEYNKKAYTDIINKSKDKSLYFDSLKELSGYLEVHYKEKVLILVDEYDVPITAGYLNGYYDKVIEFIRAFLSAGMKTNEHLWKGILTGCLRVSKESIFTGLNNMYIASILSPKFNEYFGLIEDEVKNMAIYYGLEDRFPEIKECYDGYLFGNTEVYNPWSIINYMYEKPDIPKAYWVNTSGNQLVKRLLVKGNSSIKKDLQVLVEGSEIEKPITDNFVYPDIDKKDDYIWDFLLFSGYLRFSTKWSNEINIYYKLTIPNKEVRLIYQNMILDWINEGIDVYKYDRMTEALLNGENDVFTVILNDYLVNSISYFDSEESFYHGLTLGMLMKLSDRYFVRSNRESGYGRYDIMLIPKDNKNAGIIIEFKMAESYLNETMEEAAQKALDQIAERQYEKELESIGCSKIIKYGISFKNKKAYVLMI